MEERMSTPSLTFSFTNGKMALMPGPQSGAGFNIIAASDICSE